MLSVLPLLRWAASTPPASRTATRTHMSALVPGGTGHNHGEADVTWFRHGDDGLTDRQRRRSAKQYADGLGKMPSPDSFARARAMHATTVRITPPTGQAVQLADEVARAIKAQQWTNRA